MAAFPKTFKRVAAYRQVVRVDQSQGVLFAKLKNGFDGLEPSKKLRFQLAGQESAIVWGKSIGDDRLFLHLVTYQKDAQIGLVPDNIDAPNAVITEADPPPNFEFIKTQFYVLITRLDDIAWAYHNSRPSDHDFQSMMGALLIKFGQSESAKALGFTRIVDFDKARIIRKEGVKRIEFNVGALASDLSFLLEGLKGNPESKFREVLGSLDRSESTGPDYSQLHGRMILDAGPFWADAKMKAALQKTAGHLANSDDDQFLIITGRGNKIRASKLTISPKIDVKGTNGQLDRNMVESQLNQVITGLEQDGIAGKKDEEFGQLV